MKLEPRRKQKTKQNPILFFLRYYLIYNNKKSQRIFEKNNNDKGYIYSVDNSQILISSSGFSERTDRFRQRTQFENERKKIQIQIPTETIISRDKIPVGIPVFERENEEKKRLEIINKC